MDEALCRVGSLSEIIFQGAAFFIQKIINTDRKQRRNV